LRYQFGETLRAETLKVAKRAVDTADVSPVPHGHDAGVYEEPKAHNWHKAKRDIAKAKAAKLGRDTKLATLMVAVATMLATAVPLPSPAWADGWHQVAELVEPGTSTLDAFGGSVALSGRYVVVGDHTYDRDAGRVFVFSDAASGWQQASELTATATTPGDQFGASVAISGNTVVVGAPRDHFDTGRAYVFTQTTTGWHQAATLVAPGSPAAALYGYFGAAVAVSGSTVVVGAPGYDNAAGAAYVYSKQASGWHRTAELVGSGTTAGDDFGLSVAISGDTVVAGAAGHDNDAGAAYVFTKGASGWHQTAELVDPRMQESDTFGDSVAISGKTLLVCARLQGYVFDHEVSWHRVAVLAPTNGYSCDISGSVAVLGFFGQDQAPVFAKTASGWHRAAVLAQPGTGDQDSFGLSVAVSGNTVVVGGGGPADSPGVVYVYQP
jgi:hypothetical protein